MACFAVFAVLLAACGVYLLACTNHAQLCQANLLSHPVLSWPFTPEFTHRFLMGDFTRGNIKMAGVFLLLAAIVIGYLNAREMRR